MSVQENLAAQGKNLGDVADTAKEHVMATDEVWKLDEDSAVSAEQIGAILGNIEKYVGDIIFGVNHKG